MKESGHHPKIQKIFGCFKKFLSIGNPFNIRYFYMLRQCNIKRTFDRLVSAYVSSSRTYSFIKH